MNSFLNFMTSLLQLSDMCCAVLSCSVVSDSLRPCELQPVRLLCPWGFSRQEYWSGLPYLPPGDLPNSGIKSRSPVLQAHSLPSEPPGKPNMTFHRNTLPLEGCWEKLSQLTQHPWLFWSLCPGQLLPPGGD